ncbi:uncharacterized protein PHACADRAFT_246257 [Phanerochaete carnosa HHB-10118-sp]|uniref:Peptidase A1 domain-containing protein n=1 Tax=Phanerochaete carnosa (strain HHB-10118-sp) TaxID=650164 RepID=K5W8Y0_PHACS|nr:uncharacterized protein PHACADRAFT_246257 [Phanerochaete carnosa HHB-10118-sp]EKM60378.1 hypothetical protein PHACADRAFT_246257 [Phanerochaete carnosa HHB-10118-sp]
MFHKATLVAVAFALLTAASPVVHAPGIKISLEGRSTPTRADGTFDHEKATLDRIKIQNKYQRNLRNLLANTGRLPEGWEVKEFLTIPLSLEKRAVGTEALVDEDEIEWLGLTTIGTPGQSFKIDFDTGSSDLWVPSSSCYRSACADKSKYNAVASATSSLKNGTIRIGYGEGSGVSGPIYTDTVIVAGLTATDQYFSPATTISSFFETDPTDGVMGLAYPSLSSFQGQTPFFSTLISQRKVNAGEFGFTLGSVGSELYLGGTDTSKYTGDIEYHSIDTSTGLWQASGAKCTVGSKTTNSGFNTIIDSGTTSISAPESAVNAFYVAIPGSQIWNHVEGSITYPCNLTPDVSFSWGGKTWEITRANFNLGETHQGSGRCFGALFIASDRLGLGNNTWLVGDAFMKNVYTTFSFDKNAVGFATLKV